MLATAAAVPIASMEPSGRPICISAPPLPRWRGSQVSATRATLGHTGGTLHAGPGTCAAYALVGLAALLRIAAPLAGGDTLLLLVLAGAAWSGAFGLFVVLYFGPLTRPRVRRPDTR